LNFNGFLKESPRGVVLALKVIPRAKHTEIAGIEGDFLKIRVHSAPIEGAANQEILDLLRKIFKVPRKNIQILRGEKSRSKLVEIQGLNSRIAMAAVLSHHKS